MAIQQGAKNVRDIEQEDEKKVAVIVDINDTSIADGEQQEVDAKEDWQAQAAPPPGDRARYRFKIFTAYKTENTDFEQGRKSGYAADDDRGVYYIKNLTCKIQDEGGAWNNTPVDYKVSTGVGRGKKVSSMAGIMLMAGAKLPEKMSDRQLAVMFAKFLVKEPILVGEGDWSAWDSSAKSKDNPYGKLLLAGMKNFPKKADGKPNHVVKNKNGQEYNAKLKIVKWVGKASAVTATPLGTLPASAGIQPVKAKPPLATKPVPAPVEEIEVVEGDAEFSFDEEGEVVLEG